MSDDDPLYDPNISIDQIMSFYIGSDDYSSEQDLASFLFERDSSEENFSRQRKYSLSKSEQEFKDKTYFLICNKKVCQKNILKAIHDELFVPKLGFKHMSRSEFRVIKLYFKNYYVKKDEILSFLQENKNEVDKIFINQIIKDKKKNKNKK